MIIVDDDPDKYKLQPNNGIKVILDESLFRSLTLDQIAKFEGDDKDVKLLEMLTFLEGKQCQETLGLIQHTAIVQARMPDVRPVIERYNAGSDVSFTKQKTNLLMNDRTQLVLLCNRRWQHKKQRDKR